MPLGSPASIKQYSADVLEGHCNRVEGGVTRVWAPKIQVDDLDDGFGESHTRRMLSPSRQRYNDMMGSPCMFDSSKVEEVPVKRSPSQQRYAHDMSSPCAYGPCASPASSGRESSPRRTRGEGEYSDVRRAVSASLEDQTPLGRVTSQKRLA